MRNCSLSKARNETEEQTNPKKQEPKNCRKHLDENKLAEKRHLYWLNPGDWAHTGESHLRGTDNPARLGSKAAANHHFNVFILQNQHHLPKQQLLLRGPNFLI